MAPPPKTVRIRKRVVNNQQASHKLPQLFSFDRSRPGVSTYRLQPMRRHTREVTRERRQPASSMWVGASLPTAPVGKGKPIVLAHRFRGVLGL
jgi:hypothetical protein